MYLISEIVDVWLGLCRKPPIAGIMQTGIGFGQEPVLSGQPAGSGGGLGSIRRGIGAALEGMKMLNRNRQLLWFTLLAGLALVWNVFYYAALRYLGWNLHISLDSRIGSYALEFIFEFATMFFLVYLIAALVLGISSRNGGTPSFFQGLIMAKKFKKSLAVWASILAVAGMLLFYAWFYFFYLLSPEFRFFNGFGPFSFVISIITQFPFNWTLDLDMLTEFPGYGGRSLLLWIYPYGVVDALPVMGINILLIILTPFVIPQIVLEHKTVWQAVTGSFALIKKIPGEAASAIIFLGAIVGGVFLSYLLIQAVSGIVSPWRTIMFHPSGEWIALALLYNLVLVTVVLVMATVGGIVALDLYSRAKAGLAFGPAGTK
ncbi:MAG: hypothetical protein WC342_05700 [Methanoregula sp.]|jgi:hypothetical protein